VSLTEHAACAREGTNPATASKAGFLASLCGSHPAKGSAAPETGRGSVAPPAPGFPRVYFRSTPVTGCPQARKATEAGKARKARKASHGHGNGRKS
jgi:hypothetical protein